MLKSPVIKLLSFISCFLIFFFSLINNINYLLSTEKRQNDQLKLSKQRIENRLQSETVKAGGGLSLQIDNQLKVGAIEIISPRDSISITQLQPPTETNPPAPQEVQNPQSPNVIAR